MAWILYGFDPSLVATDAAGNTAAGVTLAIHTTYSGSNPFTATKAVVAATLTAGADTGGVVTSDSLGRIGFFAQDYTGALYVRQGSSSWAVNPTLDSDRGVSAVQTAAIATAGLVKVSKGELVLNVKDYGVTLDGLTDDTVAYQACLDAALTLGAEVFHPPGRALVSAPLRAGGITLRGVKGKSELYTPTWFLIGGNTALLIFGSGGAEISNAHLDGLTIRYGALTATRQGGEGLAFRRCHSSSCRNATVINSSSVGISLNRVEDFTADRNTVDGTWADGICADNGSDTLAGMTCKDVRITNNLIQNVGDDGISFVGRYSGGDTNRTVIERVTVTGNIIRNMNVIGGGIGVYGVRGAVISGNQIIDPQSHGIRVIQFPSASCFANKNIRISNNFILSTRTATLGGASGWAGIRAGDDPNNLPSGSEEPVPSENLIVENNLIVAPDRHGIHSALHSSLGSTTARYTKNVTIRNNKLLMVGGPNLDLRGIHMENTTGLIVEGNEVTGYSASGMIIRRTLAAYVRQNRMLDCVASATFSTSSVMALVDGNDANDTLLEVRDNHIRKNTGTAARGILVGTNALGAAALIYDGNTFDVAGSTMTSGNDTITTAPSLEVARRSPQRFRGGVGFYGTAPVAAKPTISGSQSGEAASSASLRSALVALGLVTDTTTVGSGVGPTAPDLQVFTSSGTWTMPAGAKLVRFVGVAAGSGGASGRRGAVSTVRCGGGGGAGGGYTDKVLDAADLTSTVTVTVGAGGTGGAAVTTDDTNGNAGGLGAASLFGAYAYAGFGGTAPAGGTNASGTGGTAGTGLVAGSAGAAASVTGGAGASAAGAGGPGGGGAGGGITSGNVAGAGGLGVNSRQVNANSVSGGVVDSTSPSSGTAPTAKGAAGPGAGGGAASITAAAQAGASAVGYGGGGGGGGASLNGNNSGAGGNGAPGYVLVITTF